MHDLVSPTFSQGGSREMSRFPLLGRDRRFFVYDVLNFHFPMRQLYPLQRMSLGTWFRLHGAENDTQRHETIPTSGG